MQVLNSISLEESNAYILGQAISLLEGITLSLDKLDSLTSTSSRGSDEGSIGNVNTNMVEGKVVNKLRKILFFGAQVGMH